MAAIRIATYNLWASDYKFAERLNAACDELSALNPDVLALQEVRTSATSGSPVIDVASYIQKRVGHAHLLRSPHAPGEDDGLVLLSKHELAMVEIKHAPGCPFLSHALRAFLSLGTMTFAVTNVHLDYRSVVVREQEILAIVDWIEATSEPDRHEVLLGDFNSYAESSVYRFLMGQQSVATQASIQWHDLAKLQAVRTNSGAGATLDFETNPRWAGHATLAVPARCDWILIQDTHHKGLPYPHLHHAGLFGSAPLRAAALVPSDHYGVFADVDFVDGEVQAHLKPESK